MFERFFISKFKICRLHRAEVHRVLWKIKEFVCFCGSVQPISLRTLHVTREKLPKQHSYKKRTCIGNVDEIDGISLQFLDSFSPSSQNHIFEGHNFVSTAKKGIEFIRNISIKIQSVSRI
jgi:hypothetical protein